MEKRKEVKGEAERGRNRRKNGIEKRSENLGKERKMRAEKAEEEKRRKRKIGNSEGKKERKRGNVKK